MLEIDECIMMGNRRSSALDRLPGFQREDLQMPRKDVRTKKCTRPEVVRGIFSEFFVAKLEKVLRGFSTLHVPEMLFRCSCSNRVFTSSSSLYISSSPIAQGRIPASILGVNRKTCSHLPWGITLLSAKGVLSLCFVGYRKSRKDMRRGCHPRTLGLQKWAKLRKD